MMLDFLHRLIFRRPWIPRETRTAMVVDLLGRGDRTGRDLHSALRSMGLRQSVATFYMMMVVLEGQGYVIGFDKIEVTDNTYVKERWYRLPQ